MKNKPFVILSPGFPASEEDSACLPSLQLFVRTLKKNNPALEVIVISFQYPFMAHRYNWHGVNVIALGGKNKGGLYRLLTWIKAKNELKKLHKNAGLTGILSFWLGECAFVSHFFAEKHTVTHYCWLLGQDARRGNRYYHRIKPSGEELIAISDAVKNELYRNYKVNTAAVIPIGTDSSIFEPGPLIRDIDILGAGSLIPLKRFDLFIEIVYEIKKIFPDITVAICGEGTERHKLWKMLKQLQLQDTVIMLGELPHHDVIKYMQRSRVLLHPSSYEGFSTVCAEALHAGVHVISFCRPMENEFDHWHIVDSKEEMTERAIVVLSDGSVQHNAVVTCPIGDTVSNVLRLFHI